MSKNQADAVDSKVLILEAKRNALYECIQSAYDLSRKVDIDDEISRDTFLTTASNIENIRSDFQSTLDLLNNRMLEVDPTAKPDFRSLISFEQLYCNVKRIVNQCLAAEPMTEGVSTHKNKPKLAPIELVPFCGDIRKWPLFFESFNSNVHSNPSLTDADKLYYLLGKLTGKAQSAIAGITPCPQNYKLILQTLKDKYEDKRTLASMHLNNILEFKPMTSASINNFNNFNEKLVSAVRALKNMKINDLSDFIFFHIALSKLDSETVRSFEINCGLPSNCIPPFDDIVYFVQNQAKILQRITSPLSTPSTSAQKKMEDRSRVSKNNKNSAPNLLAYLNTDEKFESKSSEGHLFKCLCSDVNVTHQHLYKCPSFMKMTPENRFKTVKGHGSCINCLSVKHRTSACTSDSLCRTCNSKHHTLLHFNRESNPQPPQPSTTAPQKNAAAARPSSADVTLCSTALNNSISSARAGVPQTEGLLRNNDNTTVLIATAQVETCDVHGNKCMVRCLVDSAAQSHFITEECRARLGIPCTNTQTAVVKGFGGSEKSVAGSVEFKFCSRYNPNIKFSVSAKVTDKITEFVPTAVVDTTSLSHLKGIPLADDMFAAPNKIDVLLGASLFPHLLLPGIVRGNHPAPPALESVLGYIIMGSVPTLNSRSAKSLTACCVVDKPPLDKVISKFWELEELPSAPIQSRDDLECEDFYRTTTTRDTESGRYVVSLPFRDDVYLLGDSMQSARKRFMCLERKLEASPKLRAAYDDVIKEYIEKGYISPSTVDDPDQHSLPSYVIPHHGVIREDKTSTRLRVVLDASNSSNSGRSLNDILHTGPNLQGNLFEIIINFRIYAVAMTADCRQQFLQIVVSEDDRRYQRILYRFSPKEPLTVYQFNRVCFGLKSSPYHALRTVHQLIEDDGAKYPRASEIAIRSLYMDDIAFSVKTEAEGEVASAELIDLFKGAQWDLIKWNSNSQAALDKVPATHKLPAAVEFDKSTEYKILGLHWSTVEDYFYFKIVPPPCDIVTKRTILSTIARLWDIMDFVAPCILYAKLIMKQLWQLKLEWDDQPYGGIVKLWRDFCVQLPALNEFRIPRFLGVSDDCVVTLVGFGDASESAYGGVLYLHVSTALGNTVSLVCAKSKLAPSPPRTIAQLELCGAVVLSKLLRIALNNLSTRLKVNVHAFLDSKVALYWIKSSPHRWKTFVANRVVQVTENINADSFHHVSGTENPADCLSRGSTPEKLMSNPLWLHGPKWLSSDVSQWPIAEDNPMPVGSVPEQKILAHPVTSSNEPPTSIILTLADRTSSWPKLLRVIVYIYRFMKVLPRRGSTAVSAADLDFAEAKLLRAVQCKYFSDEQSALNNDQPVSPALNKLRPFLHEGLIRVGGRLDNADLAFTAKHPVMLPRQDRVVELLISHYHVKYLHAGPESIMSRLRQRYWIISARRIVRQIINRCNTCFRIKPRPTFPLMASLPSMRTTPAIKAFSHTGCDYAGPIPYSPIRRRGVHSERAYLCIFTCLTTRAVHIELTTSLSTASFLDALKRFLARRGPVLYIYSDNGTNFQGANSYLRDLYKFINQEYRPRFEQELAENRIQFKFNCPAMPHAGGCWESMVRVVKIHLFKVIGKQLLSYEELNTVLVQVESLLNSRPLTVLSSDPSELTALTPSHFLQTAPLCSLPAPEVSSDNLTLLQRHSLLDKLVQSFWERWRLEYLHGLQVREKWNTPSVPIKPGTVVIIIVDNAPPLAWPLAIVDQVHPSKDGIIRVVTVKTAKGTYLRPVVRLCPLPTQ